ncbi:MAG: ECF-type sigma factor [Dokdonella sp.]
MSTTALVNELYLKFAQGSGIGVDSRRHFFALCAQAMRQILVDHARRRVLAPVRIDGEIELVEIDGQRMIEVDDALRRLEQVQPRLAQVVVCRWFAGYSEIETAEILGVTDRTVRRDWEKARAWLGVAIGDPS